ncbi:Aste57867_18742 [Aphanomyces stellatus]|uniref:Aste57867_18742 protein n=1 Tax=Aphanomyces stellatus TaxID=120398 RepID=A0A485LCD7_9STRA|nr:hypothetical protein As57867_018678 [Aphanomyces stellatus]VFT95476.1 Aste57867_18742 [Aphanomyces stellatus]
MTRMGVCASKTKFELVKFHANRRKILLVGLDEAGKTTILYKFKTSQACLTAPTIGFNVEVFEYNDIEFTMWDVGGQEKLRGLWKHYYQTTDAIVFVVDSSDRHRIHVAAEVLRRTLQDDELRHVKLLVFANKQDLENVMTPSQVSDALQLNKVTHHAAFTQPCSAVRGQGLNEGLEWLSNTLNGD